MLSPFRHLRRNQSRGSLPRIPRLRIKSSRRILQGANVFPRLPGKFLRSRRSLLRPRSLPELLGLRLHLLDRTRFLLEPPP